MPREITDWRDPAQVTADDFFVLPDNNVYVDRYGYLTEYIPEELRRDNPRHWNEQYKDAEAFREAWKPRSGPLELIYNLASQKEGGTFTVLNLGGGIGDFTVDLARIPNVQVAHVDFSEKANEVTQRRVKEYGVSERVNIVTETNNQFLEALSADGAKVDFIFIYGGLGENTPLEAEIEKTLTLAAEVLRPGGHFWYVCLEQPFLLGGGDTRAQDILGEYPPRPGLARKVLTTIPGIYVVDEVQEERPDKHPLRPGGEPEDHMHMIYRALFAKEAGGEGVETPEFDFKNALSPQWGEIWSGLTNER